MGDFFYVVDISGEQNSSIVLIHKVSVNGEGLRIYGEVSFVFYSSYNSFCTFVIIVHALKCFGCDEFGIVYLYFVQWLKN